MMRRGADGIVWHLLLGLLASAAHGGLKPHAFSLTLDFWKRWCLIPEYRGGDREHGTHSANPHCLPALFSSAEQISFATIFSAHGAMSTPTSPTPPAANEIEEDEVEGLLGGGCLPGEAAEAALSPGLLPQIGEDLSCLGGSLAAFAGEQGEARSDSDYELDDYERMDLGELLLQTDLRQEVQQILQHFLSPRRVLLRDKITFVLGTLSLVAGAFFLGYSPQTFYRLYTAEGLAMLVLRFTHYRWSKQHYYLLDWCYLANAMLMLQIWVWPTNLLLAKVTFAHSFGPLLWSILAFRNSIVYHSLDKMTSHFMHLYPACVCWTIRWHTADPLAAHLRANPAAAAGWQGGSVRDLVLLPMLPYLIWAVLYYLKVFVISSQKIATRGYETLFQYSTQSRRSLFGSVVLRAPPRLQPLVYMCLHLALTLVTMCLNQLWWRSCAANTAFLVCIFAASAWSGATFYFDHFAHKYLATVGIKARRRTGSEAPSQSTAGTGEAKKHK